MTSLDDSIYLTKKELEYGINKGIHKVTEPVVGYKKIKCVCELKSFFSDTIKIHKHDAIAELEIPPGAEIIRPEILKTNYNSCTSSQEISNKLRTNNAIVKNITEVTRIPRRIFTYLDNCICYSLYDSKYRYNIGKEHKPDTPLNKDLDKECTTGIHFFIEKSEAKKYAC